MKNAGATVNGNCDMTFKLYDDAATGAQIGSTITATVPVSNSLFTVMLNTNGEYGANAFNGYARWLEVSVKCAGDTAFTAFSPRQQIAAAPYAQYSLTGANAGPTRFVSLMRPQSIDLETIDPDLVAFHEGFTDGRYAYLVPNKFEASGKIARIDLQNFVTSTVTVLNLAAVDSDLHGFYDGFTDGRYAYFVPGFGINPTGKIARIDLLNFTAGGVTVLDLSLVDTDLKGMGGGFTDGRYAYFLGFAKVARVNLQNFTVAGVTTLDLSLFEPGLSGFDSVTDGRSAYLVPTYGSPQPGKLVRIDLQNFTPSGATTLDLTAVYSGLNSFGGAFIAGKYLYLVSHRYAPSATPAHGNLTRIDLQNFTTTGVTWIDMTATNPDLKGYQGGFMDGRYGYLAPGDYGSAVFHGKMVRFQLSDGVNVP